MATTLTCTAGAVSSLNLKSGVGYGITGLSYETTIAPNTTLEAGVGFSGSTVSAVVGAK